MKKCLGNPKNTIEIIQKYEFMFQKKFGQNFLIDTHVLDKIIEKLEASDTTLEESFACYEAGIKLVKACGYKIDKVEKQMMILQGGADKDGDG